MNFADPLLQQRSYTLPELGKEQEILQQKMADIRRTYPQAQQPVTPIWDEIERVTSTLSDQEMGFLSNNQEFMDNSMAIQEMINGEILSLVRSRIEQSPEGKEILERQLNLVKKQAKTAKEETARRDALLNEYMTHHSDKTFDEFLRYKRGDSVQQAENGKATSRKK